MPSFLDIPDWVLTTRNVAWCREVARGVYVNTAEGVNDLDETLHVNQNEGIDAQTG
jgi:hypothetical protein